MTSMTDVIVVGAGPVGLLAAIELASCGAAVTVLERLGSPSTVLKAGGIGPLGIEAMQRRGMSVPIEAAQARAVSALIQAAGFPQGQPDRGPTYSGHFGGLMLIRAEAQQEPDRLGRRIDQQGIETILNDRARALRIDIRRGCEVTHMTQHADGVDVECQSEQGTERMHGAYLLGCDGGRSFVRKSAGFDFPGWAPSMTMYQALVELDHPERIAGHGFQYTSGGMYLSFGGRLALMIFDGPPADRDAPVSHEEFEAVTRSVTQADVRIRRLEGASRWTDNTRLVDTYRRGRVFLAGDAAHIHSPFGGQGLGLGMADASNLGWKLAAVLRKEMPETLLDTYTCERRPVAEAVLANTLAQVAIMRPDPRSAAMRHVMVSLLKLDDANHFIGGMMSGLASRYDLNSARDDVGRLIGNRKLDCPGSSPFLYDLMQAGEAVLLDASIDAGASMLAARMAPRVRCVRVRSGPSTLIRPDACVAWSDDAGGTAGLGDALTRWCPGR